LGIPYFRTGGLVQGNVKVFFGPMFAGVDKVWNRLVKGGWGQRWKPVRHASAPPRKTYKKSAPQPVNK